MTRRGLELVWPGSGARIVISGITRGEWAGIEEMLLAPGPDDDPEDWGQPIWPTNPGIWTSAEQRGFLHGSGNPAGRYGWDYTWIASGAFRRAGMLRTVGGADFLDVTFPDDHDIWRPTPDEMRGRRDLLPIKAEKGHAQTWIDLPIDYGNGLGDTTRWAIRQPDRDRSARQCLPWQAPPATPPRPAGSS
ncbi:hypothetical protein ACIGO9_29735 [Nocardia asteroides]|uniref:hypothetical protein n=1 Tax=Nocardia asteroides TaxID=1824 RepID=UPI0037CC71A8